MKKYFCIETDEQVNFGDKLHLTFFKETKGGKVTIEKSITFTKDSLYWMIRMGVVEEREVGEEGDNTPEDSLLDFGDEDLCDALEALEEDFEALEKKVDNLETLTVDICRELTELVKELVEKKFNAQPKKRQ